MEKERVRAFAEKVFGDMAGAMTSGLGFVGVKTGLFRAMAGKAVDAGKVVVRDDESAAALRRGVAKGNGMCRVL